MKRPLEEMNEAAETNPIVFLDVAIGTLNVGRIVIELFKNSVPKTAENFRALCTGEKGIGLNGKPLHYKGSRFHKAVPQCMIQGGDIINFDGTSGESIYGKYFEDESLEIKHDTAGLLSMVNEGQKNTNSSQFVITTVPCPQLDETNVVFGKVLKGMGIVFELSTVKTDKDLPIEVLSIVNCGELKRGESWNLKENDDTGDGFPPYPEDWDHRDYIEKLDVSHLTDVVMKIKESGNRHFATKSYRAAERKYQKALRYLEWASKSDTLEEKPNETQMNNLQLIVLLNLAATELKLDSCREALKICNQVLAIDENNGKAFYRRGQAHMKLNEYQLALNDMKQALTLLPNNPDVLRELDRIEKAIESYLAYEKESYIKMFK